MADDGLRDMASRRANFKKTVDEETGRRNREQHAVKIRKDKRAEQEKAKRLQMTASDPVATGEAPAVPLSHMTVRNRQHVVPL